MKPTGDDRAAGRHGRRRRLPVGAVLRFAAVAGPGLVAMMADADAGSVTTAAVSGADWGYRLLLLQVLLIPVLYLVQEMTVRLGAHSGRGHARLIRDYYGSGWAAVSLCTLFVTNVGALVTEFAGVAGVAGLLGVSPDLGVLVAAAVLAVVVVTGSYRHAERVALVLASLLLLYFPAALLAHPSWPAVAAALVSPHQPLGDRGYLLLLAANVGAVVMPWMIFYQQSAVVDKGLGPADVGAARWDTAVGAALTQLVIMAVIVTTAATLHARGIRLESVVQVAVALVPLVGSAAGAVFAVGFVGSALLGALVVALATAWAFGETLGFRHSLDDRLGEAPWFYLTYILGIGVSAAVVLVPGLPLARLTVDVEMGNAFTLPLVLGFLLLLVNDRRILGSRVNGLATNVVVWTLGILMAALGLWAAYGWVGR